MKKITVLFLILFLLTGCTPKLSKDIKNKRSEFVTSLGVTKNDKIVITNKKKTQYYVYYLSNDYSYISYLYIMHDNEKKYDEYIKDRESISYYDLQKYDDMYITRINYLNGSSRNDEDIKEEIINKYKSNKNYIIIY
ncbi:hypothetical protein EGP95_04860 [bacterium]|nr:hypothetical protein [bacterium]